MPMQVITTLKAAFQGWNLSWSGLLRNAQGEWWFVAQITLIVAVIVSPAWPLPLKTTPTSIHQTLVLAGGLILLMGLGFAATAFMALGENLSPLPDPKPGIQIVRQGPYRWCRHPMYLAVLACAFGVLLMRQSPLQVILLMGLGLVLRGKAQREERCLVASHPEYAATMGQTPAIAAVIPGLNWRLPDGPSNEG